MPTAESLDLGACEQLTLRTAKHEHGECSLQAALTTLALAWHAIAFARIERVPRYDVDRRENDAEHSFMLGLIATELAGVLRPDLDLGQIALAANYHDLVELITGDTPTLLLDAKGLEAKAATEHAALEELRKKLPPLTAKGVEWYERQNVPETRWVRAVDKLLPHAVDIIGPGPRVKREAFGITTSAELAKVLRRRYELTAAMFGEEFPELIGTYQLLSDVFQARFDGAMPSETVQQDAL